MRPCRGKRREREREKSEEEAEKKRKRGERVAKSGKRETRTKHRALKEETIFASREIKMSDTMKRGVFFNFAALMQPRLRFVPSFLSFSFFSSPPLSLSTASRRFSTGPCPSNKPFISTFYFVPSFARRALAPSYARRIHLHKIPTAITLLA